VPAGIHSNENNNHCGSSGQSEPARGPAARDGGFFGDAGTNARKERGRNLYVDSGVEAGVNGGKERLFLDEGGTAGGAGSEVRAQFTLGFGAGGGGID
jgi:hypothetical protein